MNETIFEIFIEVFSTPRDVDVNKLLYNDFPGWDSLGHMTLVAALEEKFDCMLEMDDILEMSSYTKVCEIMARITADA
ncbi:MAG: acyl carrier protein [Myxococcota bacterium]|nr:acyl carrier protein [Myxococcota bacterium]